MSETKCLSATIETTQELDCERELIEQASEHFVLKFLEDGSFGYVIMYPVKTSKSGMTISYDKIECGKIGVGLAKVLKECNIEEIVERLLVEKSLSFDSLNPNEWKSALFGPVSVS